MNGPLDAGGSRSIKFLRYGMTLRYDSEGIYSYGAKIAHLDLKQRTMQKLGYRSPMSNNDYKYAAHMFNICDDVREVIGLCLPKESSGQLIHTEHISYDDHTWIFWT